MRVILATLVLGLCGACACPEARDLQRLEGQSLATPEAAVEYFREAFSIGTADDMFLCFSEALKQSQPDLTLGNVSLYKDRIRSYMIEQIGNLDEVEIVSVSARSSQPRTVAVELTSSSRKATLLLIQEAAATVQWTDGRFDQYAWPSAAAAFQGGGKSWMIDLPRDARPSATSEDIHRLQVSRDWKILAFEGTDLVKDLDAYLRESTSRETPENAGSKTGASVPPLL